MRRMWWMTLLLLAACGREDDTLCKRFYAPYPDMVSGRERTRANGPFLDAMSLYAKGDLAAAAEGLKAVVEGDHADNGARMYLASSLLGIGQPYKAEMYLDQLENSHDPGFKDQVDWYNALCWLCSGQYARALQQSIHIARQPAHTYKAEAQVLAETLSDH
jgi:tetratricopeptide (TPR) repeat protein